MAKVGQQFLIPFLKVCRNRLTKAGAVAHQRRSGSEGHRFETWCQQGFFTAESPIRSTLPLLITSQNQFMRDMLNAHLL